MTPCPALLSAQALPLPTSSAPAASAPLPTLSTPLGTTPPTLSNVQPADLVAASSVQRAQPADIALLPKLAPSVAPMATAERLVTPRAADAEPGDDWAGEPSSAYIPLDDHGSEFGIEYQLARRASKTLESPVQQALSYVGTPYRMGGTTRDGIDCSGLIEVVYRQWGREMPRTAAEQFQQGTSIAQHELQPGDLVFFRNTYKHGVSHVGIYVGDGRFIHAAGKRKGVVVGELDKPYYQRRFVGARRIGDRPVDLQEAPALLAAATPTSASTGR